jgi:hypothetical protein
MKPKMIIHSSYLIAFLLIAIACLPLIDLLHPGIAVTHDGQDHVARIANFYQSLSEGNIVPRWAANLNWGYGHPVLMFLYPLPSYIASAFHAFGFSLVDSTKMVFAVAFVGSVIAMYVWASFAWGRVAGIVASVLYAFAPYRFVDLYVRGAIGEHVAFMFPPLICYGLILLAREKGRVSTCAFIIIVSATALLILSHNALSIMFLSLIGLYVVYLAVSETKQAARFLMYALMGLVLGFLLSACYWVPAFLEGKYTLRDIVTAGEFSDRFVPWASFLYSPWSYGGGNEFSKWLGGGQILALVVSFVSIEKNSKYQRFMIVLLLLLFFTLFAMTQGAQPLWNTITLLQKFQFPWRLLSVATFLIAVIGAVAVRATDGKNRRWVGLVLCFVSVLATIPMWRAREYKQYPESFFTQVYDGTTDTGESSPIWSVRFMEKRPERAAYLAPPSGTIVPGRRSTTLRSYDVTVSAPARFVEHTLYFPGWSVFVNGKPLEKEKLLFQDPAYRGLMTLDLAPGTYIIKFVFGETKLRQLANSISLWSLIAFVASTVTIRVWQKRRYR